MGRGAVLVAALLAVWLATSVEAEAIYRCHDKEGREVLTDRPAQLERCQPLNVDTPPDLDSRKAPIQSGPQAPVPQGERMGTPGDPVAAVPSSTFAVPLQQVGHLFVATVMLNGEQEARLIVDTGASHTIVSHRLAVGLGLYADSSMGTVTMNTVGGAVQAPLARIKSIRLADAEVKDSIVVVHDLPDSPPGVEGLLGLSALRQFQVTLDPAKKVLSLLPMEK
jgi:clan AA aspartic protease (TIGR02281 family)